MGFDNLVGQTLGQYELREMLGAGGMGAVYRGYQANLRREVAVKVLPAKLASDPDYIKRFNREAEVSASLEHAHIVPIHDYGTQRNISYVVMRLLTGGSLAQRLRESLDNDRPLPAMAEISTLLRQLASALDYAHSKGVIHRDIKPGNIMFDNQGNAYVVDFGIAKLMSATTSLTGTGVSGIGTPQYMPPEQWRSEPLTPAADQYALAIVVYIMLTGRLPFEADTPFQVMHKHLNEAPTPPQSYRADVPKAVSLVLDRALAKDPAKRFPTVTAFAQAFDSAITGVGKEETGFFSFRLRAPRSGETPSQASYVPTYRPSRRNPILIGTAVTLIIIAALAFAASMLMNSTAKENSLNATLTALSVAAAPSATATPTERPSDTPAAVVIVLPPSATPSDTALPTQTASATATETAAPTVTPSLVPTDTQELSETSAPVIALVLPTETPSPTNTATDTPSATSSSTPRPTVTAVFSPTTTNTVLTLTVRGIVAVREYPDSDAPVVFRIPVNGHVTVTGASPAAPDWYFVELGSQRGWVPRRFGDVTGDINVLPQITLPTLTPTTTTDNVLIMTVRGIVAVREYPDSDAPVVFRIPVNGQVTVTGVSPAAPDWYFVELGSQHGWVPRRFGDVAGSVEVLPQVTLPAATMSPTEPPIFTSRGSLIVHLRDDLNSEGLVTLGAHTAVPITAISGNDPDWYQIQFGGYQGWVLRQLGDLSGNISTLPRVTPATSTPTATATATPYLVPADFMAHGVTVFYAPDHFSNLVATLDSGQRAKILSRGGVALSWFQIELPDGTRGWVEAAAVQFTGDLSHLTTAATPTPGKTEASMATLTPQELSATLQTQGSLPRAAAPFGAILHSGDQTNDNVFTLKAGQSATIIGVSGVSNWLYVQLDDGQKGWLVNSLVTVKGNIDSIPRILPTATVAAAPYLVPADFMPNGVVIFYAPDHFSTHVSTLDPSERAKILSRGGEGLSWFQIELPDGTRGWVEAAAVQFTGDLNHLATAATPTPGRTATTRATLTPRPTVTPKPIATATPIPAVPFLGVLLQTNFDSLPAGFQSVSWRRISENGQNMYCVANGSNAFGDYPYADFDKSWSDYSVEADIRITTNEGHVAWITRQSQGGGYRHAIDLHTSNADAAQYFMGSTGDYIDLGYRLFTLHSDQWYKLRAEVDGTQIRTFMNELPVSRQTDKRQSYGTLSIEAGPNTDICVDNLVVRSLNRVASSLAGAKKAIATAGPNMRSGPGVDFPVIGGIVKGAELFVSDTSDDGKWLYIREDRSAIQGWVSSAFIQVK